jgi:bifunctional UDP-N-acetylglucosamine pyrophosphorylase/glucosamine-1-phosphate N-acetyltransferase
MCSARAKVLHELAGLPLLRHVLSTVSTLGPERVVVVVGHQADAVGAAAAEAGLAGLTTVLQPEQRGTGHAVVCAAPAFADFTGDVLVLYGDVPLVRAETLRALVETHRREEADLTLLTLCFPVPTGYGRILRSPAGEVVGIVEERDATPAERAITEVNPGFYAVRSSVLFPLLGELRPDNAQGELYLTDLVALTASKGGRVRSVQTGTAEEVAGVNTRAELAAMEARLKASLIDDWMKAGVTFEDPATVYIGPEVTIGRDTVIGPNVTLRGKTRIGEGCRLEGTAWLTDAVLGDRVLLRFSCHLEGAAVGADAIVGPFARLRPGTQLAERVHVGNFVETKKAVLGPGTKANHLTYLGDCEIGPETNVGAGTITCNYDGFKKHQTRIGARVQIGSDTQLVAPVSVGDDAYVGAGTTVTRDVPAGSLVVSRTPQREVPGWTARRRKREAGGSVTVLAAKKPTKAPRKRTRARATGASARARRRR